MSSKKRPFTGSLRKPIDPRDARARGLRATLGAAPDDSDQLAYAQSELAARWVALDEFFGLNSKASNIWEQRAKALIERRYGLRSDGSQWWGRLAIHMAIGCVPGISFRRPGKKKHGAPLEWSDERLAQLFADVEHMKRKSRMSVRQICQRLSQKREYAERWGKYNAPGLRKAYLDAKKRSKGLLFQLVLCGPAATIPDKCIDPIEAAIQLHALDPY